METTRTSSEPVTSSDTDVGTSVEPSGIPTGVRAIEIATRSIRSNLLMAGGRTLTWALRPRGGARLRAAIAAEAGPVKLSFGAGTVDLPGWIDTDFTRRARFCLDVRRPWPVHPGSIDYIYADQVIEHFPIEIGRVVLRNAFTALTPGGRIRLSTPDVERTARVYLERDSLCAAHLERHRRSGYSAEHPVDLLRVTFSENGHRFCYDFDSLRAELTRAGFLDVRRFEAGESDEPAFQGLESRVHPTEVAMTLAVEAIKQGS